MNWRERLRGWLEHHKTHSRDRSTSRASQHPHKKTREPLRTPFPWQPGEHIAIVGDTGSGKSTLASEILLNRRYLIVLKSKPDEVTYQAIITQDADDMLDPDPKMQRLLLYPKRQYQAFEFGQALEYAWNQGGWTVYIDELLFLDRLGLREPIENLLTQGRSKGISVVVGMQRPSQVTRFAIGEAKHCISFSLEGRDASIMGEASGKSMELVVGMLGLHQFAWFYRPTKSIWMGKYQDLKGAGWRARFIAGLPEGDETDVSTVRSALATYRPRGMAGAVAGAHSQSSQRGAAGEGKV